jgi:tetratricopeptide (TPR) repeat protein
MRLLKVLVVILLIAPATLPAQETPHFNKGLEYAQAKNTSAAIEAFTKAIAANERLDVSYFNRALCYLMQKEFQKAKDDMTQNIRLVNTNPQAYLQRALAEVNLGELDIAMGDIESALKLDVNEAKAYTLRGQIWANIGEKDKACADFQTGARLQDPVSIKLLQAHCNISSTSTESLSLPWPESEGWHPANHQEDASVILDEWIRKGETLDAWTELGQVMTIKGITGAPVDTIMAYTYRSALKQAPKAKLTFIERGLEGEHPWVMFTIEAPEFNTDPKPESQLWYAIAGKQAVYTSFRAIKQATIPDDLREKWTAFYKGAKLISAAAK